MMLLFTEPAGGMAGLFACLRNLPLGQSVEPRAAAKVWYFLHSGGFFMIFIALCSLIALSVVFHRAIALRKKNVVPSPLEHELVDLERSVAEEDTGRLGRLLAGDQSALARIARVALSGDHATRDEAVAASETQAREEIVKLHSGIAVLEVVITIAPLLGLLGTVSGLVSIFGTLGGVSAELAEPAQVARGIAEALNTTIAGLVVAVPTVIAHSYFSKKIERFAVRMEVLVGMALAVFYRAGAMADSEVFHRSAAPLETTAAPLRTAGSQPVKI